MQAAALLSTLLTSSPAFLHRKGKLWMTCKSKGFGATCLSNGMGTGGIAGIGGEWWDGGGMGVGWEGMECLFQAASKANGRQSNFLWFHQASVQDAGALGNAERTGRWPLTWTCTKHVRCAHTLTIFAHKHAGVSVVSLFLHLSVLFLLLGKAHFFTHAHSFLLLTVCVCVCVCMCVCVCTLVERRTAD